MKEFQLTEAQEKILRDQVITADKPGPILRDFRVLLDFVGSGGVEVGGKYNLLPMKFIGELDGRLSRPLRLELKRPQLRSHPYLQGLNLLLRASGLVRVEGSGSRARMRLDPAMMAQWDQLNPTERYFQLLEAWLLFGRPEMVGERGPAWKDLLTSCLQAWQLLPAKGFRLDPKKSRYAYVPGFYGEMYLLALMDLFGFLEVEHPPRSASTWSPAGVKHVPFGDAVFTLLRASLFRPLGEAPPEEEEDDEDGRPSIRLPEEYSPGDEDDEGEFEEDDDEEEDEDDEPEAPEGPRFGAWQPLFEPYFPEWRENLEFPEPEVREGEFIFRVGLGKVWRLIAMPAESTLDDLLTLILRSVDFDSDHLYEFAYRDRRGAEVTARDPRMEEGPWASQVRIGTLPLEPGQAMQLTYDFGDNWSFVVKLERIDPPVARPKKPRILESHGKAPEQYPNWDE